MSKKISEKSSERTTDEENLTSGLDLNSEWGRFLRSNVGTGYDPGKRIEPNVIRYGNIESMNLCEENALILRPGTILEITSLGAMRHINELTLIGSSQDLFDFMESAESMHN